MLRIISSRSSISSELNLTRGILPNLFLFSLAIFLTQNAIQVVIVFFRIKFLSCMFALIMMNSTPVTKQLTDKHELDVNFCFFTLKVFRLLKLFSSDFYVWYV